MEYTSSESSKAISLLVKKSDVSTVVSTPTRSHQIFHELVNFRLIDETLLEAYGKARDFRHRALALALYFHAFPDSAARSEWFKTELLCGLESAVSVATRPRPIRHRVDPVKLAIARLKRSHPDVTALQLCSLLDRNGSQIPKSWQLNGDRTWTGAYRNPVLRPRVKTYLAKIKP